MNTETTRPIGDFSDLDELPGPEHMLLPGETRADYFEHSADFATRTLKASNKQRVEVACPKCRGSGSWGFTHRVCFGCNGSGKVIRAANYEQNKKARDARKLKQQAEERAQAEADAQCKIDAFKASKPEIAAWLAANRESFDFARSLCDTVARYGNLSVNQEAAVLKILGRDQLKEAQLASQGSGELDISALSGYYAVPDGETRLKVRVHKAGKQSKWNGTIFVDDGAAYGSRQNYGRQSPGGKYRGRIEAQLRAILADPKSAQIAYGKLTGTCGHCGRALEDATSVELGIGPICLAKLG